MARQSSRKRPLEHGPQDDRPAKTTKNSHLVEGTSIDLPPVKKVKPSPDQTPHAAQTSPPSSASPPSLPTVSEDNHSVNDCTTTTLPLTRRNLKMLDTRHDERHFKHVGQENPVLQCVQQFMEDAGIYMDDSRSKLPLANLKELRKERDVRPSLAPSQCSDGEIEDIIQATRVAASEQLVVQDIIPRIVGRRGHLRFPHSANISWSNMTSMTNGLNVAPQPDLYYGIPRVDIDESIRDSIAEFIVPSTVPNAPALPHCILEIKGPSGSPMVLKRQIVHSAAAAARAQFTTDNFGKPEPEYNHEPLVHAWTFSSETGNLTHDVMHISKPKAGSSQPGFHTTRIKTYVITDGPDEFRKGVSAFRYWRDDSHAKSQQRLKEAHARAALAPNEDCISVPLPEARQEDVNGSTAPLHVSEVDGDMGDPSSISRPKGDMPPSPLPPKRYSETESCPKPSKAQKRSKSKRQKRDEQ